MWQCKHCETHNDDQSKFCIVCNSSRAEQEEEAAREELERENASIPHDANTPRNHEDHATIQHQDIDWDEWKMDPCDGDAAYSNDDLDGMSMDSHEGGGDSDYYATDDRYCTRRKSNVMAKVLQYIVCIIVAAFGLRYVSDFSATNDAQNVLTNMQQSQGISTFQNNSDKPENNILPIKTPTDKPTATRTTPTSTSGPTTAPTTSVTARESDEAPASLTCNISPSRYEGSTLTVSYEDNFSVSWHADNAACYDVSLKSLKKYGDNDIGNYVSSMVYTAVRTANETIRFASGDLSTGSYVLEVIAYNSQAAEISTNKKTFNVVSTTLRPTIAPTATSTNGKPLDTVSTPTRTTVAPTATSTKYTDMMKYLLTSMDDFVNTFNDMTLCEDALTVALERYSNGVITVETILDLDGIIDIELVDVSEYCICGIYVGMNKKEAHETLIKTGWKWFDDNGLVNYYKDSEGKRLRIVSGNGYKVDEVSVHAPQSEVSDMFSKAFDDDATSYPEKYGTICTTGKVNVRKGPGTKYTSICVLESGTYVTYSGISSKDDSGVVWHRIDYGRIVGWVSSKYLKTDD